MVYLIKEQKTIFKPCKMEEKIKTIGYYECDSEEEVNSFCINKTNELKGTYNEDILDITFYYKELTKLN